MRQPRGYRNGWEHLAGLLEWLDVKIGLLLERQQGANPPGDDMMDPFKGLVVSEQEVYRLLEEPVFSFPPEDVAHATLLEELEAGHELSIALSAAGGVFLPLPYVADVFQLTALEQQILLIALAVEVHRKYEKLYAYLQDDVTAKSPTVDLVVKLLGQTADDMQAILEHVRPDGTLFAYFFKRDDEANDTLLSRKLRLEPRMIRFLLQTGDGDEVLARCAETFDPQAALPALRWEQDVQEQLRRFVDSHAEETALLFLIAGNPGSGKKLHARHTAQHLGKKLVLVNLREALQDELPLAELLSRALREAKLQQAVLGLSGVHLLLEGEEALQRKQIFILQEALDSFQGIVFLLSEKPWKAPELRSGRVLIDLALHVPPDPVRQQVWEEASAGYAITEGLDWRAMAGKFRFTIGQIEQSLLAAKANAHWQQDADTPIGLEALHRACYAQVQHNLEKKAVRITPRYTFEQLILPDEQKDNLKNACNQMKFRSVVYGEWGFDRKLSYGKGLSMLFAGPPGTGKTMSAEVIAKELHLEIYKIDLSQVISKYIGETEKNLQEIFAEAQLSSAILFFDEADALFGKRSEVKDSHDKYANVETAYLLQKMEEYEGITILASNFQQNMDEAFMRRINYVIKFPFPDAEYREMIWRGMFPKETPLDDDLDFRYLAEKFQFAGGNIKNIVMSAAFLAVETGSPVGMRHLIRAIKHELGKTGKLLLKHELDEFQEYLGV
ncbi:SpoVK/Ycf46/Vps4 family AAA+-type ATPase [Tumebacillus sp. BK434]|uniref:AAA family ATPase n=1 Tax=Tumebacillus sp. BK434 TaxID=2512169 RepID=UPI001048F82E|nr:ATP-binding protein [Tumebacillus sp. BK434]TCP58995.1 SpoVK/Ycf46/Vps4 family AAA+-type ATPase [Tumebacillus sp. BK434]